MRLLHKPLRNLVHQSVAGITLCGLARMVSEFGTAGAIEAKFCGVPPTVTEQWLLVGFVQQPLVKGEVSRPCLGRVWAVMPLAKRRDLPGLRSETCNALGAVIADGSGGGAQA